MSVYHLESQISEIYSKVKNYLDEIAEQFPDDNHDEVIISDEMLDKIQEFADDLERLIDGYEPDEYDDEEFGDELTEGVEEFKEAVENLEVGVSTLQDLYDTLQL